MNLRKYMSLFAGLSVLGGVAWTLDHESPLPGSPVKTKRSVEDRQGPDIRTATSVNRKKAVIDPEPDFLAAAEEARAIGAPGLREEMTRRAMQAWAMKDPAAALAWAEKLPLPGESEVAMIQVCTQVAESDPAAAIRQATGCHLDEIPGDVVGNFAASWAERDLSAARECVTGQPADELRDQLMERIVFEYAKSDPSAAARLVADRMGSGESQIEAAISVLHQWSLQDLPAATAWVEKFPEGELRDRAVSELAGMQLVRDAGRF
jgi:hypothetical protein